MYIVNSENRSIRINHGATLIEVKPFDCCEIPKGSIDFIRQVQKELNLTLSETAVVVKSEAPKAPEPKAEVPKESEPKVEATTSDSNESKPAEEAPKQPEPKAEEAPKVTTRRRRKEASN